MQKIAVIAGEFHRGLMERMLEEVRRLAPELKLNISSEIWVPGCFEVPLALQHALQQPAISAVVLLGIIERGETKHGLVMGQAVFPAIVQLQLEHKKPVGIGIIGPEVLEPQIEPRLLPHAAAAIRAVRTMLDIISK